MKRISILLGLTILFISPIYSQNTKSSKFKKFAQELEIHGFVKSDYWLDSRQVAQAREGLFTLFPLDRNLDQNGQDLNDFYNFNMSAITSRVNLKIPAYEAFGGEVSGFIEADFSGMSNSDINGFRLRHAYLKMHWDKSEIIFGQFWHPMFVKEAFPHVISLNTGAPFQPFNRSPQIRFYQNMGNFGFLAAITGQRDYATIGPKGRSFSYLSNTAIPNITLRFEHKKTHHIIGVAGDFKRINPQIFGPTIESKNSSLNSYSAMLYSSFKFNKLNWSTRLLYSQNMADHLILGGYAVSSIDSTNKTYQLTNNEFINIWNDLEYSIKKNKLHMKVGLFGGYSKNLGFRGNYAGIYYGTNANIASMYRISPRLSFISGKTMISLEYEITQVEYGKLESDGIIRQKHWVNNNRILVSGFYFF